MLEWLHYIVVHLAVPVSHSQLTTQPVQEAVCFARVHDFDCC